MPATDLPVFVCVCSSQPDGVCVLNVDVGAIVSMSLCSFHSGRCHGDPLFFVSEGVCDPADSGKLEWAKFRAAMSSKSSVQVPCDHDTCYEWETCSGEIMFLPCKGLLFTQHSGCISNKC